jgi:hypothetical protein
LIPHKIDHARQLKAGAAALLGVDAVTLRRALKGLVNSAISWFLARCRYLDFYKIGTSLASDFEGAENG